MADERFRIAGRIVLGLALLGILAYGFVTAHILLTWSIVFSVVLLTLVYRLVVAVETIAASM